MPDQRRRFLAIRQLGSTPRQGVDLGSSRD
jgi:hypothetical protein